MWNLQVVFLLTLVIYFTDSQANFNRSAASGRRDGRRRRDNPGNTKAIRRVRSRVQEGDVRLMDGSSPYEGRIEIFHAKRWGPICDDDWDSNDVSVVCRQLGFNESMNVEGYKFEVRSAHSGKFGYAQGPYWLDNVYCEGSEARLTDCRHEGWGIHDCEIEETAGAICARALDSEELQEEKQQKRFRPPKVVPPPKRTYRVNHQFKNLEVKLAGGRVPNEGRVLVRFNDRTNSTWGLVCGDGWSLLEANVVCRQLNLGFAEGAPQTNYFGGTPDEIIASGFKCFGQEDNLTQCYLKEWTSGVGASQSLLCPGNRMNFASVICNKNLPDLIPDAAEIEQSAYLEDKLLFSLQCAMEENCLSSSAYALQDANPNNLLTESRRLLRFTARIMNAGNADFRPFIPKHMWQFHACHMHYHSMEVFAVFDILNSRGVKVAEGHKASFCLEDNECIKKEGHRFACANFGDQGISIGCADVYRANIDCQWVDITDLSPGQYTFKVAINGEMKVAESDFSNNGVICSLLYTESAVHLNNCTLTHPF